MIQPRLCILVSMMILFSKEQNTANNITCPYAHFLSVSNSCVECLTTCSKCTGLIEPCTACSEAFYIDLKNNKCEKCNTGQLWCSQTPLQCQPYYKLQNGVCNPVCPTQGCQKCASIVSLSCIQCKSGYKLKADTQTCIIQNKARRLQAQNNLIKVGQGAANNNFICAIGEYLDSNGFCSKCESKCRTCIGSAEHCLQCKGGWEQVGWKCVKKDHLMYDLLLAIPKGQEEFAVGHGINEMKNDFAKYIFPENQLAGFQGLSLVSAALDNVTNRLSLKGILQNIGNSSLEQLKKTVQNKFKVANFFGPFALLKSNFSTNANDIKILPPIVQPDNNYLKPQQLAKILIPAIILGLILLTCFCCCCCYCFKLCCFKKNKQHVSKIQTYESERKQVGTHRQLYEIPRQPVQTYNYQQPVPQLNPPPSTLQQALHAVRRVPTMESVTSINMGQPKQKPKIQKYVSRESYDHLDLNQNPQKIVIYGGLKKGRTLAESQVGENVRTVIPISSQKIDSLRISEHIINNAPIVTKQKAVLQNGYVKVETGNQYIPSSPEVQYHYVNSKGEQIQAKNLSDVNNLQSLRIKGETKVH